MLVSQDIPEKYKQLRRREINAAVRPHDLRHHRKNRRPYYFCIVLMFVGMIITISSNAASRVASNKAFKAPSAAEKSALGGYISSTVLFFAAILTAWLWTGSS